jgi:hypothetical protein
MNTIYLKGLSKEMIKVLCVSIDQHFVITKYLVVKDITISLTGSQLRIRTRTRLAPGCVDTKVNFQKHMFVLNENIDLKGYYEGRAVLCGSGAEFYTHTRVTRKHMIKGTVI